MSIPRPSLSPLALLLLALLLVGLLLRWLRRASAVDLDSSGPVNTPNATHATPNYAWSELGRRATYPAAEAGFWPIAALSKPVDGALWDTAGHLNERGEIFLQAAQFAERVRARVGAPVVCTLLAFDPELVFLHGTAADPVDLDALQVAVKAEAPEDAAVGDGAFNWGAGTVKGVVVKVA